jgi:hypothetical protein
MKKVYHAPALRAHGLVEAQTKGNSGGDNTDDNFPINTPFADITFT